MTRKDYYKIADALVDAYQQDAIKSSLLVYTTALANVLYEDNNNFDVKWFVHYIAEQIDANLSTVF